MKLLLKIKLIPLILFSLNTFALERIDFIFDEEVSPLCLSPISNRGEEYRDLADKISNDLKIEIKDDGPIDQVKFEKFKNDYLKNGNTEEMATSLALQLLQKSKGSLLHENTFKYIKSIEQAIKFELGQKLSNCEKLGEVKKEKKTDFEGNVTTAFHNEYEDWGQRFYNLKKANCSEYANKIFNPKECEGIYSLREGFYSGGSAPWFEYEAIYIVHNYENDFVITPLKRRFPDDAFDDEFVDNCMNDLIIKDDAEREKNNLQNRNDEERKSFAKKTKISCNLELDKIKSNRLLKPSLLEAFK